MPLALIKSLAKKSGKTEHYIETLWHTIKSDIEKDRGELKSPEDFASLVAILKKALKLNESFLSFKEHFLLSKLLMH